METGAIIVLSLMAGVPVSFYAYRLVRMRIMGKITLPKKQIIKDFSEAFDYAEYEVDETTSFAK